MLCCYQGHAAVLLCVSLFHIESIDLRICNVDVVPARGLYTLFQSGRHTDITFNIGGTTFKAHRVVVASQSDFFDR